MRVTGRHPRGHVGERSQLTKRVDWERTDGVERRQETGKVPKGKKKQTGNWQEEKLGKPRK